MNSIALAHTRNLIALLTMDARERAAMLLPLEGTHSFEGGSAAQQLMNELQEALEFVGTNDEWIGLFRGESIVKELEALLQLVAVVTGNHPSERGRLLDSSTAMASEPEWLLIGRLARDIAAKIGPLPRLRPEDIAAVLSGEEVSDF